MFLGFASRPLIARYIGESKVGMETDAFAIADCMGSANSVCVPACHGHQKMLETMERYRILMYLSGTSSLTSRPLPLDRQWPKWLKSWNKMIKNMRMYCRMWLGSWDDAFLWCVLLHLQIFRYVHLVHFTLAAGLWYCSCTVGIGQKGEALLGYMLLAEIF